MSEPKKLKVRVENVIDMNDWDNLVTETYGRPYSFQQQDDCKSRGVFRFSVPAEADDYDRDTVPEIVNHHEMGVSFAAWLKRDPNTPLANDKDSNMIKFNLGLWWDRNFYPDVQMIANDLHSKGLLEAGDYTLNIDW